MKEVHVLINIKNLLGVKEFYKGLLIALNKGVGIHKIKTSIGYANYINSQI